VSKLAGAMVLLVAAAAAAQESMPVFKVTVVGRTAKAINYRHRDGATKVDFQGTTLLPRARGEAKVESKQGYIEIEVEFDHLEPATRYGPEYLTYVLWAISPEGRSANLGEVLLNGERSKLNVTTDLQVFGLIVTGEPHFAVTLPSDVVVMENVVRKDTAGRIEEIDARYELLPRGQYTFAGDTAEAKRLRLDPRTPIELFQARNAVRIARSAGALRSSPDTFRKAEQLLAQAEAHHSRKGDKKQLIMTAREAAQRAEDSRLIAAKRQDEERLTLERRDAAGREASARSEAEAARAAGDAEARRRAQAEADRFAADRARLDADRARLDAEHGRRQAELEVERVLREREQADRGLRSRLLEQLRLVLETRPTPAGFVVTVPAGLFEPDGRTLVPAAREKLAKISGLVLAHSGLEVQVSGDTEERAAIVRDYLVAQAVPAATAPTRLEIPGVEVVISFGAR